VKPGKAEIVKGRRFAKILGNFGENLVCNWLARSGFDVVLIDHTGIDVVAYLPATGKRLGITVKSRTRLAGTENECVNLFSYQRGKDDRQKVIDACRAFACKPWIAVYVEATKQADLYMTSLGNFDAKYGRGRGKSLDVWSMGSKCREQYARDPLVKHIHVEFDQRSWGWNTDESRFSII
jgi:hypothetical protein